MSKARDWADGSRKWRWPLAFIAAISAVAFAVLSHYSGFGEVCDDAVASTNKVHLCGPPSLGDLVLLFVPTLLLLLPDMSELSVLGVSLKRVEDKVDRAENDATAQVTKLAATSEELVSRLLSLEHTARTDAEALRASVDSNARALVESATQLGARIGQLEKSEDPEPPKPAATPRKAATRQSGKGPAAKRNPKRS